MGAEGSGRLAGVMISTPRRPRAAVVAASVAAVTATAVAGALGGCGMLGPAGFDAGRVSTVGEVDFVRPLAIPPLAESTVDAEGRRVFELTAAASETRFTPDEATPTWGYNGSYLGPTLVAREGERVVVDVHNALDAVTTLHWHGMHLPAEVDGGPHQPIEPGESRSPAWTVDQRAATLWYHPHPHGDTEGQVARGLAGMFIVQDDAEAALPLPRAYGVDDIPVMVQDTGFSDDGTLDRSSRGFVGALGDTLLVNGTIGPYLDVSTEAVRLRLLNASTARTYDFAFDDGRVFEQVASDGGLLAAAHVTDDVQLSPGERAEIVVRVAPGERTVLRSGPPDLGTEGGAGDRNGGADSFDVLELRPAASLAPSPALPDRLVEPEELAESDATVHRDLRFDGFVIDQDPMDLSRIDQVVEVGDTEIWTVRNGMALPHNLHVHDAQFRVLSIDGERPPAELAGRKDTLYLRPQTDYRLILRFDDYTDRNTPYMYHCHLLWHEDQGMMGQFVVVEPGQGAGTIRQGDDHDH
jgi:suppressor of ftsI